MAASASSARLGDDGLHDGVCSATDAAGRPGDEDRAVLVAHRLGVQGADEAACRSVPRQLEQRRVEVGVRIRRAEEVAALEQLAVALEQRTQHAVAPASSHPLGAGVGPRGPPERHGPAGSRPPRRPRPSALAPH